MELTFRHERTKRKKKTELALPTECSAILLALLRMTLTSCTQDGSPKGLHPFFTNNAVI